MTVGLHHVRQYAVPKTAATALRSPSLFESGSAGPTADEHKFLLTEELARGIEARGRNTLFLDPHADPARSGAYSATSIYTHTANLDAFYRTGGFDRNKFRARRYGVLVGALNRTQGVQGVEWKSGSI